MNRSRRCLQWKPENSRRYRAQRTAGSRDAGFSSVSFHAGTTSIESTRKDGRLRHRAAGGARGDAARASASQRRLVTDAKDGPHVIAPGKRPRVTPRRSRSRTAVPRVRGAGRLAGSEFVAILPQRRGFGMTMQAVEAPNINSFQMRSSFGRTRRSPA